MTTWWRLATCAAVLLLANNAYAETVEDVQKKLNDVYGKLKSYSARTETIQNLLMDGAQIDGKHEGSIKWKRNGDKIMSRIEQHGNMTQKYSEEVQTAKTSTLTICDGEYYYNIAESSGTNNESGTKTANRQKADPALLTDVLSIIHSQKIEYKLRLLPDEKVDGADCYVIECVPKVREDSVYSVMILWFRKADAIMVKMIGKDKGDRQSHSYELSDVQVNADIPDEQFKFTAPPGVEVLDLSAQPVAEPTGEEEQ